MSALAIELAQKLSGERERMTRYIAIAEHCPIPAFVIDTEVTTLVYVNPAFTEFTGYTLKELRGELEWQIVIHPDDREKSLTCWENLKQGIPVRAARKYTSKTGNTMRGVSIIERVEDNGFVGFILPQCGIEQCPIHYLKEESWHPQQDSHLQPDI